MSKATTVIPRMMPAQPVFIGAGLTHVGVVRERNEDSILTDPTGVLWAVADGMGGYSFGDVASDMVIDALSEVSDHALAGPALQGALRAANARIHHEARTRGSMGATAVALMIQNAIATIAWVGDCRAYLLRGRALRLLTHDHTVVQDMVDRALIGPEETHSHPERHVVTRAVGHMAELQVDTIAVPLVPDDRVMLCSDGLTGCLSDQEITDHMARAGSPKMLCTTLLTASLEAGAADNVSVVSVFAERG
ncbi:protein phosphatase 2C domain-containing protein [uncultured Shimia sp.]|uniref:PP2C family protein-serine/threonine phosphatase n=1 Tax=uncultured Shimia sp. TaxID=573152 RepID=UPI0025DEAD0D|nr:protein phosphatase 2C domain-containing protein [uncultured Shimia sp.]